MSSSLPARIGKGAFYAFALIVVAVIALKVMPRGTGSLRETSPLVGKAAPGFELPKYDDGGAVSLASLKGKVVVLDFWATWCPPCVEGMPRVEAIAERYKDRDVELFAVNVDDTREKIAQFIQAHNPKSPILLAANTRVGIDYQVEYIPQIVVIDKQGIVRALQTPGPDQLEPWLTGAIESALK